MQALALSSRDGPRMGRVVRKARPSVAKHRPLGMTLPSADPPASGGYWRLLLILLLLAAPPASRLEGDQDQPRQRGTGPAQIIDVHQCAFRFQRALVPDLTTELREVLVLQSSLFVTPAALFEMQVGGAVEAACGEVGSRLIDRRRSIDLHLRPWTRRGTPFKPEPPRPSRMRRRHRNGSGPSRARSLRLRVVAMLSSLGFEQTCDSKRGIHANYRSCPARGADVVSSVVPLRTDYPCGRSRSMPCNSTSDSPPRNSRVSKRGRIVCSVTSPADSSILALLTASRIQSVLTL